MEQWKQDFRDNFFKTARKFFTKKTKTNGKKAQVPPQQKLFRFTRGNTPLTAEQQLELFRINEANLKKIQSLLRQAKGIHHEKTNFNQ